jgi:hypothetical protein
MTVSSDEQSPADPRLAGLAELARAVAEHRRPPLELWHPLVTADIGLRITADGSWHTRTSPIHRPALVRLFASILRREADGKHYLVTPVEKVLVEVDDAPLLAVEMWVEGQGVDQALSFRGNLDDLILPGKGQPMRFGADPATGAPKPYLALRHGLEALATRSVYLELVETGRIEVLDGARTFGVWSRGCFFPMSPAEALE